jgi:hypothetical protein
METNLILSIISIVTTFIVGVILYRQIKSQTALINHYKGFAEAIQPDKIITLHKRQIEQLQDLTDNNIKELQAQVIELGYYVDHILTLNENSAKSMNQPELFVRQAVIDMTMPKCANILNKIHNIRQSNVPNAK